MLTTLLVLGGVAVVFMNRCEWLQLCGPIGDLIKGAGGAAAPAAAAAPADAAAAAAGTYDPATGGYTAPAGGYKNTGNYKGMPGWYTASGHHHCTRGEKDCVCTDPPKCMGIKGTGHEACTGGKCAPGPGQCRPDLGRYGAGPCNTCPPGTGGGKCAAGGAYAAKYTTTRGSSYYTISNSDDPYPDIGREYVSDDVEGRYIDLGICVRNNQVVYNPVNRTHYRL